MSAALNPQQRAKLGIAAKLVREVASEMNVKGSKCGACGLNVRENVSEFRLAEQLDAAADKLDRIAVGGEVKHGE